jgi:3-hydroxyacyl-CoA dehydrogenase
MKKKIFADMDALADDNVVLASSSSCLYPSLFSEGLVELEFLVFLLWFFGQFCASLFPLSPTPTPRPFCVSLLKFYLKKLVDLRNQLYRLKHKAQCLVAHPVNPPLYIPLVELVAAPWTDAAVVAKTRSLMTAIGQVWFILPNRFTFVFLVALFRCIRMEPDISYQ